MNALFHAPYIWQCLDCLRYSNDSRRCPACASTVLWPVGKTLDRKPLEWPVRKDAA
jgi:hypothetical protein